MITTHVLDTALGAPAVGVTVILEVRRGTDWDPVGRGATDEKGRLGTLTDGQTLAAGTYRLTFDLASYHHAAGVSATFFPEARIAFSVRDPEEHYHVPLLVSPFGYTTYRGA